MGEIRKMIACAAKLVQSIPFCVNQEDMVLCESFVSAANSVFHEGNWDSLKLSYGTLKEVLDDCKSMPEKLRNSLSLIIESYNKTKSVCDKYKKKAEFIQVALKLSIKYVNWDEYGSLKQSDGIFLFLSEKFDGDEVIRAFELLRRLTESSMFPENCFIVDLNAPCNSNRQSQLSSVVIKHIRDGKVLCKDVVKNITQNTDLNYVQFKPSEEAENIETPSKRTLLKVSCPVCPKFHNDPVAWTCFKCTNVVEYCYDGLYHCDCGYSRNYISFRCRKYYHLHFVPNSILATPVTLQDLNNLPPLQEVNILLIGQSGVGKSTWINGFVNYLQFPTLEHALKGQTTTLVPGKFTQYDSDHNEHVVVVGDDENEDTNTGSSATQACRSYVIYYKGARIALIDTPGLGDTRGFDQDKDNVQDILKHLQLVKEIHAVCFLLLPNETRSNASLKYSLKEIMCFLHRSATPNLIFGFTNSRATGYRPGETFPLLQKIMDAARVDYVWDPEVVYMFDSESYRFLCAVTKTTIVFEDNIKEAFKESWNKSSSEAKRLLDHVMKCKPYNTEQSVNIGWVRFKLLNVMKEELVASKPLSIDSIIKEIEQCESKIKSLQKHLHLPIEVINEVAGTTPRLVCGTPNCGTVRAGGLIYKTCMLNCYESTNYKTRPNVELLKTPALSQMQCTVCGCRWETHMVINFDQTISKKNKINVDVKADIKNTEDSIGAWRDRIKQIQSNKINSANRCDHLKKYAKVLAKYVAQHSFFLYNDAITDYLDFVIRNVEGKSDKTELDHLQLEKLKANKLEMSQLVTILEGLQNVEYVHVKSATYLDLEKVKEAEANFNLNLPQETVDAVLTPSRPEKRVAI